MKLINLKNLKIEMIDGSFVEQDLSKEIANLLYKNTEDIGMLDVAMTLYKEGEVEMNDELINLLRTIVDKFIKAFVKRAIFKILE